MYLYFLAKISELLDTVFFVLRKKERQISFLHMYHHTVMPMISWGATKYYPGGHGTFIGKWMRVNIHDFFFVFVTCIRHFLHSSNTLSTEFDLVLLFVVYFFYFKNFGHKNHSKFKDRKQSNFESENKNLWSSIIQMDRNSFLARLRIDHWDGI